MQKCRVHRKTFMVPKGTSGGNNMSHFFNNTWRRKRPSNEGRKQRRALPSLTGKTDVTPTEQPTMPLELAKEIWRALLLYSGGELHKKGYVEFITLNEVLKARPLYFSKPGHPVYDFKHEHNRIRVTFWNGEPRAMIIS